ncbi:MAG: hypothetical protein ACK4SY_09515, partial [Pyrobaculum sp.]
SGIYLAFYELQMAIFSLCREAYQYQTPPCAVESVAEVCKPVYRNTINLAWFSKITYRRLLVGTAIPSPDINLLTVGVSNGGIAQRRKGPVNTNALCITFFSIECITNYFKQRRLHIATHLPPTANVLWRRLVLRGLFNLLIEISRVCAHLICFNNCSFNPLFEIRILPIIEEFSRW